MLQKCDETAGRLAAGGDGFMAHDTTAQWLAADAAADLTGGVVAREAGEATGTTLAEQVMRAVIRREDGLAPLPRKRAKPVPAEDWVAGGSLRL